MKTRTAEQEQKNQSSSSSSDSSNRDDSFVRPPEISLPKGGGAIRGIDEKFQVNPTNGSASQSISIYASPGRSDFTPQLTLSYDSGSGNGPFGFGWSLSLPSISRKTNKGLPRYRDFPGSPEKDSDVFLLSGAEDLVPDVRGATSDDDKYIIDSYRPRIEGLFARIERWKDKSTGIIHWRSFSPDNVLTVYGGREGARIADPEDRTRIFQWLISESFDDKGNAIVYRYRKEDLEGVDTSKSSEVHRSAEKAPANAYLERVQYCNSASIDRAEAIESLDDWFNKDQTWHMELLFDYNQENTSKNSDKIDNKNWDVRNDPFSNYIAGFEQRTYRLCQRVLMRHHFPAEDSMNAGTDQNGHKVLNYLVRTTNFTYNQSYGEDDKKIATYLTSSTQYAFQKNEAGDAYLDRTFPPVEYTYSKVVLPDQVDPTEQLSANDPKREIGSIQTLDSSSLENLPQGIDNGQYQWVDLDGEGVSGVLYQDQGAWYYKANQGGAKLAPMRRVRTTPSTAQAGTFQLVDLAGDGTIDVAHFDAAIQGFYERTDEGSWTNFRPFQAMPNLDWSDPNQRLIDLTGDGHADILITEHDVFTWYPSEAEKGYGPAEKTVKALDEESGPRLVFADGTQSIYLADLCGDGLTDFVRVRNGEICYWPNLGYGKFGVKVTMDNAPHFDHSDQFDQRRIQFADIDGSGNSDIVYLGKEGVTVWLNESGNGWSNAHALSPFLRIDNFKTVSVFDLLGDGTACLVWSSPLPGDSRTPLRYMKLMPLGKPHLLKQVKNNLGAETEIEYAPSTKFYLQDKAAGTPWVTKIPFPVHVVEKVTIKDKWRKTSFSTSYSYHHGFFDGVEREFRGFGRVEQLDIESFSEFKKGNVDSPYITEDKTLYQPPIKSITWFHTGAVIKRKKILSQFKDEYFPNNLASGQTIGNAFKEAALPEPNFDSSNLNAEEWREGLRACKGMMLRQEVYELDIDSLEGETLHHKPVKLFSSAFHNCHIQRIQEKGNNRHAVFLVTESEAITYHYEQDLTAEQLKPDPRVVHTLNLSTDEYGNVLESAAVAYKRSESIKDHEPLKTFLEAQNPDDITAIEDIQNELHIAYTQNNFTNDISDQEHYRLRVPYEVVTYDITGIKPDRYFKLNDLRELNNLELIAYHKMPGSTPQKRIVEHVRTKFFKDDISGELGFGELGALGLTYEAYTLALTEELLMTVFGDKLKEADTQQLLDSKTSGYLKIATEYWIRSGIAGFADDADDADKNFYLPERYTDPFDAVIELEYDDRNLFIKSSTDTLKNKTSVEKLDYRLLAPLELKDINDNLTEVLYDIRGLPTVTALKGKGSEADNLTGIDETLLNPTIEQLDQFFISDNPFDEAQAKNWLGNATTRHVYHFGEQQTTDANGIQWGASPACACGIVREQHSSINQDSPIQVAFEYSDGSGTVLVTKNRAEPEEGLNDLRWISSGKTILNNKGKPVKQYEPYFVENGSGHHFEEPEEVGVTPIIYYDSLDRVVRTEFPDGTLSRAVFNPWYVEAWDQNDTVLESTWLSEIENNFTETDPQGRAAKLTKNHAGTPVRIFLDTLGREVISIEHNRTPEPNNIDGDWIDEYYTTITKMDAEGKPLWITDARKNRVMEYVIPRIDNTSDDYSPTYDIAGNLLFQHSMDAGDRWMLTDAAGQPFIAWDFNERQISATEAKQEHRRYVTTYDDLRRPVEQILFIKTPQDPEESFSIEKLIYGEEISDSKRMNLRGQLYRHWDPSGLVENTKFDFKGNLLDVNRRLASKHEAPVINWSQTSATNELEAETFIQITEYDAINRMSRLYNWHKGDRSRVAVYEPEYNERGVLKAEDLIVGAKKTINGHEEQGAKRTHAIKKILYDAKGQRTLLEKGNNTITRYYYDEKTFRLLQLRTTRSNSDSLEFPGYHSNLDDPERQENLGIFQQLNYTYDPTGNITEIYDEAWKPVFFSGNKVLPKNTYVYDAVYRLVLAKGRENIANTAPKAGSDKGFAGVSFPITDGTLTDYTQIYTYDSVGNFLEMAHKSGGNNWKRTYTSSEDSNRLDETTLGDNSQAVSYQYDTHGSMLNLNNVTNEFKIRWDYRDMIHYINLQAGGGREAWYNYDSQKQRTRKIIKNSNQNISEERIYLGGFEIYRRTDNNGLVVEEIETHHLFVDDERALLVEDVIETTNSLGTETLCRYQYGNHLGSVGLELDKSGGILSYEEYHPYGTTAYGSINEKIRSINKRYRYTGMERDEESGLNYHSARYYLTWLGRWGGVDPIGIRGGVNVYQYTNSNPIRFSDQQGRLGLDSILNWRFKSLLQEDSDWKTGMFFGVADGILETAQMGIGITVDTVFNPVNILSGRSKKKVNEYFGIISSVVDLVNDSNKREQAWDSVGNAMGSWWSELTFKGTEAEAGYQQGKVAFDVLSMFIGVGEIKALLKTGKLSAGALRRLKIANEISQEAIEGFSKSGSSSSRRVLSLSARRVKLIDRLEQIVDRQNKKLADAIRKKDVRFFENLGYSNREGRIAQLLGEQNGFATAYGDALERAVKRGIQSDAKLSKQFEYIGNKSGIAVGGRGRPDFRGRPGSIFDNQLLDLTTNKQAKVHYDRYYGEQMLVLRYDRLTSP